MADLPEAGRLAAHVLLDAVTAWDPEARAASNTDAMKLALTRMNDIDGAITGTYDDETKHVALNASNLLGGVLVSTNWLVRRLAEARGVDPELVITDLRSFLDR